MSDAVVIALLASLVPTIATVLSHIRQRARDREKATRDAAAKAQTDKKLETMHDLVNGGHKELLQENETLKAALTAILDEIRKTPNTVTPRTPAVR